MNKKAELFNLLNGSILGGSLMMIWIGIVLTYFPKEEAIAYLVLIAIVLVSVFLTQKYSQKTLKLWYFLTAIIASIAVLIFSQAFQTREIWRLFLLSAGVLIVGLINLSIFLIRTRMRRKTALKEKAPVKPPPLVFNIFSVIVIFILPLALSIYMRYFLPPLVEPDDSVIYDYTWKGQNGFERGLFLYCVGDVDGDYGTYDWLSAAYLVSREWYESPFLPGGSQVI